MPNSTLWRELAVAATEVAAERVVFAVDEEPNDNNSKNHNNHNNNNNNNSSNNNNIRVLSRCINNGNSSNNSNNNINKNNDDRSCSRRTEVHTAYAGSAVSGAVS